jgi:hypothetical protein
LLFPKDCIFASEKQVEQVAQKIAQKIVPKTVL